MSESRKTNYKQGGFDCRVCGVDLRGSPRIVLSLGRRRNRFVYFCSIEHLKQAAEQGMLDEEGEKFKQWACKKGGDETNVTEETKPSTSFRHI